MTGEEPKSPSDAGNGDARPSGPGLPTLDLPARSRTHRPAPEAPAPDRSVETLLTAGAALILGFLLYRLLAAQHLDLFMFSVGTVDELAGGWTDVIGYVYACVCSLLAVAVLRWLIRREVPARIAYPGAVALALFFAAAAVGVALATLTMLFMAFGIFGLFFHSGDR